MTSGPIISWQIDGETVETVTDFIFGGSKITADGDCSHEIKRCLLLGRKAMTNIDSILKSRDITLPTKVHLVKAMVFPVVMYGCESWIIKKAERRRMDASELWCWRRLLRVPWTARRPNQSILKEISPEYSLEGLMLELKLQYLGQLMWRTDSLEKTQCWERLKAGGEGGHREWDGRMALLTQWTWAWVNSRSWWWTGKPGVLQSMGLQRVGHNWVTERNWTEGSWQIIVEHHYYYSLGKYSSCINTQVSWNEQWLNYFSEVEGSNYLVTSEILKYPPAINIPVQFSSVAQLCLTLCDPMNRSTPGLPVHHQLPEFTQAHVHWVSDAIQPSHPLPSSPPAFNLSQHQGLFQWIGSLNQVAKVLEIQLQHQSFQWIFRIDSF